MLGPGFPNWAVAITAPLAGIFGMGLLVLLVETVLPGLRQDVIERTPTGLIVATAFVLVPVWIVHHRKFMNK